MQSMKFIVSTSTWANIIQANNFELKTMKTHSKYTKLPS